MQAYSSLIPFLNAQLNRRRDQHSPNAPEFGRMRRRTSIPRRSLQVLNENKMLVDLLWQTTSLHRIGNHQSLRLPSALKGERLITELSRKSGCLLSPVPVSMLLELLSRKGLPKSLKVVQVFRQDTIEQTRLDERVLTAILQVDRRLRRVHSTIS